MIQRRFVLGALLVAAAIIVAVGVQLSTRSGERCANPAAKAELRAARRSFDEAVHGFQAAMSGGSLYAGAKVAAADPVEVEEAGQRRREAFERLQRARVACGLQVAA